LHDAAWRQGRLVIVRGEAGIGKSSLVAAFAAGRSGRVFRGWCDPVVPPRPLAAIHDIADQVGGELQAAVGAGDRSRIISAALSLLRSDGGPWVAVLEDLQWADETTLDLVRVIGRRASQLRAVVVVTVRDDEVGPEHPLRRALGEIPTAATETMQLPPLTVEAVHRLAEGTGVDPRRLHLRTGGNPFFVSESLAAGGAELPLTVREAVLSRVQRLSPPGRRVIRAASVLGPRSDLAVLSDVADLAPEPIDECVTRGLLRGGESVVEFRHELARLAVLDSIPPAERSELHRRALLALRDHHPPTDLGELARHALAGADADAVLDLAPRAGAEAARLGAHQAALTYFQSALRFSAQMPAPDRAALFAAYAHECFLADHVHEAVTAQETALGLHVGQADERIQGLTRADLAEYLWWDGQAERAFRFATEAVELLESSPADPSLARAYARLAGMLMRSGRHTIACRWAEKAVELSERSGDEETLIHALNTLGSAEISLRIDGGWRKLEESLERARVANLEEDVSRALNNLIAMGREQRCYQRLDRYSAEAAVFFDEHDLDASERCLIGDIVEGLFERGRWAEATSRALPVVVRPSIHGRVQCVAVLGRVAARRGDPDPFAFLDEALTLQESFGGERMYPLRAARAEAALLAGDVRLAAREIAAAVNGFDEHSNPWYVGEFAFWARQSGVGWDPPIRPAEPYALYLDGHPEKAAAAWAGLGCPYEEALCLAGCDEVIELQRALGIFQSLGAAPAARMVTEQLRAMGVQRLPRGPRRTTRGNPAGLSDRELQVLVLLAGGKRNSEIAGELVVSTRTVDHHVSAILTKLGVRSRYEAGRKAVELGIGPQ
jgi:DNA-binding CsgD family transcriptional regulator/DNA-directed RNA polymerase subunit K/omega/tetratricopeptide (TPR) repeat protein